MQLIVNELKALTRYFLFWLIMCFIDRMVFIFSFYEKIGASNWTDIFRIYFHGLALDFSTVSYVCALPFLVYCTLSFFKNPPSIRKALNVYTAIFLFVFFAVSFVNINIYREWGDKISKRAIDAFWASPSGAVASAESTPMFIPLLAIAFGVGGGYYLYSRMFNNVRLYNIKGLIPNFSKLLIGAFILFTFIRGGYGPAALNPSKAYFTDQSFYNHAAVNTHWALLSDYFSGSNLSKNPYRFYQDEQEIHRILQPVFHNEPDSALWVLQTKRPNIVLVILESFVGQLVKSLGGEEGVTPQMEKLIAEGILFDQIYSAADRSDKGIIGTMSGFPAQGPESIIKHITKHENMPAIGQELDSVGYSTSFYHGGQSEFYNFKSYMLTHGISRVVDISNFSIHAERTSWGVYDHLVFEKMLKDFKKEPTPFFSTIFTLINHEPFRLNGTYKFGDKTNADKFRSTAYYTDSILYDFISQAKKEPWYKNTLFVFIADHGHRLPADKWDLSQPQRFHIPLLFYGDVIKKQYRGKVFHQIGGQTDLAYTLLRQLDLPTDRYHWSKDLFNPTATPVTFYNSKDAFGIITPEQVISFDNVGKSLNYLQNKDFPAAKTDSLLNIGKAFYQEVYQDFLRY